MEILYIGFAYILGLCASALRLPPLVGYLGAGLALAFMGFESEDTLAEIGHFGVLFLLFTVGLHLRIKNILRAEVLGVGSLHLMISTVIFFMISAAFGYSPLASLIIAVMLGFSSTVIAAKALESRRELGAFHGRVAIGILIVQDLVAIVLLAFTGGETPSLWALGLFLLPLVRPLFIRILLSSNLEELELLFGLLLALGGGALFSLAGLSSELGALVMGALLSGHPKADELSEKLWGLKEAFLVGFFLQIGLTGLPSMADLMLAAIFLAFLPVKAILFFLLFTGFRLKSRTAFMSAVSLSSYSEFSLIAGAAAAATGLIPESVVIVFALITTVSYALNAPVIAAADTIWKKYEKRLILLERDVRHPEHEIMSLGNAEFLVIGMGRAGAAAYDYLRNKDLQVVGIDIDPQRIESNIKEGRRALYGDPQDPELWQNIDLSKLKAIMLSIQKPETKIRATKLLRENNFTGEINALTMHDTEHKALSEAGANGVCLPITQAGQRLAQLSTDDRADKGPISLNIEI